MLAAQTLSAKSSIENPSAHALNDSHLSPKAPKMAVFENSQDANQTSTAMVGSARTVNANSSVESRPTVPQAKSV